MNQKLKEQRLKRLNQELGWVYGDSPRDDKLYFVTDKKGYVFTATAHGGAANGWTNSDTWEDFNEDIVAYKPLQLPFFKV